MPNHIHDDVTIAMQPFRNRYESRTLDLEDLHLATAFMIFGGDGQRGQETIQGKA